MYRSFNTRGQNDPVYGDIAIRVGTDYACLWNPSNNTNREYASGIQGLQIAINGEPSNPGYRDQIDSFPANSDVHFYFIGGDGKTLGAKSSLRVPIVGPNLPSGYDSFCYITTLKTDANGHLLPVAFCGNKVRYTEVFYSPAFVINPDRHPPVEPPGHALTRTEVSVAAAVPAISLDFDALIDVEVVTHTNTAGSTALFLNVVSGNIYSILPSFTPGQSDPSIISANANTYLENFPNIGQKFFYYFEDIDGTANILERYFSLFIRGYTLPC